MQTLFSHSPDIPGRHFLAVRGLSREAIGVILDKAESLAKASAAQTRQLLAGRTQFHLFLEHSTRTQASFEVAGKKLGADVVNMRAGSLSLRKGETLIDTALTLNAMKPDVLVLRHQDSGAAALLARKVDCAVINGGDGWHEHPTQALADALTIRRRLGRIEGLTIAICGDILHSRVARSNFHLLREMGARVRFIAPPSLLPPKGSFDAPYFTELEAGLQGCDIVMLLRLQHERMGGGEDGGFVASAHDYFARFGLTAARLAAAKKNLLVMHPGPMNRGIEIDGELADDITHSLIQAQVEAGVLVRMAVLALLLAEDE